MYVCMYVCIYIYIYKWGHWLEMDQYKRVPNQCLLIILKRINSILLIECATNIKTQRKTFSPRMLKGTFSVEKCEKYSLVETQWNIQSPGLKTCRGLIEAVFNIRIPILGTLIWACPNLIFSKNKTTVKHNSSFCIKSAT